mmetsp:Transcript_2713/g.5759  ORF Transcript_2713/g.5759 Transcript_2713/m.5759 type:complete len:620 (-) Transcript_2713:421-2280(-)
MFLRLTKGVLCTLLIIEAHLVYSISDDQKVFFAEIDGKSGLEDYEPMLSFSNGDQLVAVDESTARILITSGYQVHEDYILDETANRDLEANRDLAAKTDGKVSSCRVIPSWASDRLNQNQLPLDGSVSQWSASGQVIYLLNTGVNDEHQELLGHANIVHGYTVGSHYRDTRGIGTFLASLIAGKTCGITYGATIINVKIVDDNNKLSWGNLLRAFKFCQRDFQERKRADKNFKVATMNLNIGSSTNSVYDRIVLELTRIGINVVVPAGKRSSGDVNACKYSPGRLRTVITVAPVNNDDKLWNISRTGKCVDILVPGGGVLKGAGLHNTYVERGYISSSAAIGTAVTAVVTKKTNHRGKTKNIKKALLGSSYIALVSKGSVPGKTTRRMVSLKPEPTKSPTKSPTKLPSSSPTKLPSTSPTGTPTGTPTRRPTAFPTNLPTFSPADDSRILTPEPTSRPTRPLPTRRPSRAPTTPRPSRAPTRLTCKTACKRLGGKKSCREMVFPDDDIHCSCRWGFVRRRKTPKPTMFPTLDGRTTPTSSGRELSEYPDNRIELQKPGQFASKYWEDQFASDGGEEENDFDEDDDDGSQNDFRNLAQYYKVYLCKRAKDSPFLALPDDP